MNLFRSGLATLHPVDRYAMANIQKLVTSYGERLGNNALIHAINHHVDFKHDSTYHRGPGSFPYADYTALFERYRVTSLEYFRALYADGVPFNTGALRRKGIELTDQVIKERLSRCTRVEYFNGVSLKADFEGFYNCKVPVVHYMRKYDDDHFYGASLFRIMQLIQTRYISSG